jgi:ABC-type lipoprotein release transport system permease subunit
MLVRIAFRNIFRQKRRTLLTALTMFGGFTLCSFSIAWMDGSYNNVIDMFTRNRLGHIQVHHNEYLDRPSLYRNISDYGSIGQILDEDEGIEAWAPRLYSAGLASVGNRTAGVQIIGVDLERETLTTRFDKKIMQGSGFSSESSYEALLGKGLAKRLHAEIGNEVVILSQAADGSVANDIYKITGIVDSGDEMSDQMSLYLGLAAAQELFVLDDRVHEIAIIAGNINKLYFQSEQIAAAIGAPDLVVEPWQEFARSFYDAMKADQKGNWISLVIITMLVAIGVLNTVLMNVLERTREYGLMRAMGTSPSRVFSLVITEVVIMAILSVIIAGVVSYALNYGLSFVGIPLPVSIEYGGVTFDTMNTEINLRSYMIPLLSVVLSAAFISIFPAIKAARTRPAVAMRAH